MSKDKDLRLALLGGYFIVDAYFAGGHSVRDYLKNVISNAIVSGNLFHMEVALSEVQNAIETDGQDVLPLLDEAQP